MAPLCGLPQLLSDHGLDADAVIRAQGCNPLLFRDPDNTIAFSALGRLLAHAAEVTGCRYPGLELGRHWGIDALGVVGRTARLAPDVGSALRCLILNLHLHDRGAVPYLWTDGEQSMFGYSLYCTEVVGTEHIYDTALAIGHNIMQEFAGPGWHATKVLFHRAPPANATPFRQHFSAPLRFGAYRAAIVFPAADLKRPSPTADPNKYAVALRDLESLDVLSGGGLADKVRRLLLRLLTTETSLNGVAPDREAVANLFALTPRTLNRRLRTEGTSFAALLAAARYDIARELLRDTQLQLKEVAWVLGYADDVSFIHAFRRWSGATPSAWRSLDRRRCPPS